MRPTTPPSLPMTPPLQRGEVAVAVLDNGVYFHPDFALPRDPDFSRLYIPRVGVSDLIDNDRDPRPSGSNSHGTRVAGVIHQFADGRNDGDSVRILPVRISNDEGDFPRVEDNFARGGIYAINNGARVLNGSFALVTVTISAGREIEKPNNRESISLLDNFISSLRNSNAVAVIAAGNNGWNSANGRTMPQDQTHSFALYPNADARVLGHWLAVVATEAPNGIARYSNGCGNAMQWCLAASGFADFYGNNDNPPSGMPAEGTSFAAPRVSAALAILFARHPTMTASVVVDLLFATATDAGDTGTDSVYGRGVLNLEEALRPQGATRLASQRALESGDEFLSRDSYIDSSPAFGGAFRAADLTLGVLDDYDRVFSIAFSSRIDSQKDKSFNLSAADFFAPSVQTIDYQNGFSAKSSGERILSAQWGFSDDANRFHLRREFGGECKSPASYKTVSFAGERNQFDGCRSLRRINSFRESFSQFTNAAMLFGGIKASQTSAEYFRGNSNYDFGFRYADGDDYRQAAIRWGFSPHRLIHFAFEGGRIKERINLLGAKLRGGLGLESGGDTVYAKASALFSIDKAADVYASYISARTKANPKKGGVIDGISNLYSRAFQLGINKDGIMAANDSIRFDVIRPLSVRRGRMDLEFIGGYAEDESGGASYRRDSASINLAGDPPTIFALTYRRTLNANLFGETALGNLLGRNLRGGDLSFALSAARILNSPSQNYAASDSQFSADFRWEF